MSSLPTTPIGKKIPKNQRSKRALLDRAPKLIENTKSSMCLQGPKSSQLIKHVLKDMHALKSPDSKVLSKKNITRPFEDPTSIEFLSQKNDQSLFAFGSHSKKRPHNLIVGRIFDNHILDMFEFGVDEKSFKRMHDFGGEREAVVRIGSKPMVVFQGDTWDTDVDLMVMKNFWLDYFRGSVLDKINLAALDRVIAISAVGKKIFFRHYGVVMKKAGAKTPRVVLDEVGPRMDLTFRRRQSAADELQKQALKQPRAATIKQGKNIETGAMGDKMGRIHMKRQDLDKMALARMKGLKRTRADADPSSTDSTSASATSASTHGEPGAPARKKQAFSKKKASS